jgi:adiponectin receptor
MTEATVIPPTSSPGPVSREEKRQRWRLLNYDQMPEWYKDNEHIRTGYRPISGSARRSFASWAYLHNETINIFSHMLPAIAFFLGGWYMVSHLHDAYKHSTLADYWIFSIFLVSAVGCLGLSTLYHTLGNHSHEAASLWLRMDYVGIVLLTLGDFVSGIYMVFWCEPLERKIYWVMVR